MPGLALVALAALLAASPSRAATTFAPETLQCDGTYAAGSTTRHPTPVLRVSISDPVGLKIGQDRLGIVPTSTRALWRMDSGVAITSSVATGAIDCNPFPDEDRVSYHWDYTDPNGSQLLRVGTCVYDGDCSGGFTLNGGLSRVPLSLGACPGAAPALGATTVFSASTLNAALFTNKAAFNGALSQRAISNTQTIDWDLGATYTLTAWIRTAGAGVQRILSTERAGKFWGISLNGGALSHYDSRDSAVGSTVTVTVEANPTITTAPPSGLTAVGSYRASTSTAPWSPPRSRRARARSAPPHRLERVHRRPRLRRRIFHGRHRRGPRVDRRARRRRGLRRR